MKTGDNIICINIKNVELEYNDFKPKLTLYKQYKVRNMIGDHLFQMLDDSNHIILCYEYRFITLLEYRKRKLKKLYENRR